MVIGPPNLVVYKQDLRSSGSLLQGTSRPNQGRPPTLDKVQADGVKKDKEPTFL